MFDDGIARGGESLDIGLLLLPLCGGDGYSSSEKVGGMCVCVCAHACVHTILDTLDPNSKLYSLIHKQQLSGYRTLPPSQAVRCVPVLSTLPQAPLASVFSLRIRILGKCASSGLFAFPVR